MKFETGSDLKTLICERRKNMKSESSCTYIYQSPKLSSHDDIHFYTVDTRIPCQNLIVKFNYAI